MGESGTAKELGSTLPLIVDIKLQSHYLWREWHAMEQITNSVLVMTVSGPVCGPRTSTVPPPPPSLHSGCNVCSCACGKLAAMGSGLLLLLRTRCPGVCHSQYYVESGLLPFLLDLLNIVSVG